SSTVPRDGTSSPARRPSSVVFPLPDGPTMATNAPCGTSNETSRSTASGRPPLTYSLVNSRATSMRLPSRGGMVLGLATGLVAACGAAEKSAARTDTTRSAAATAPAVASPIRVVFVGTSLTAGLGLDPDSAYPARIQRKADPAG